MVKRVSLLIAMIVCLACRPPSDVSDVAPQNTRPHLLLVTMDTTRADCLGFENPAVKTPNLDALAARGTVFTQAYTTAPTTLPAHTSMLTGLLPSDHHIHENARFVDPNLPLLSEGLKSRGYRTAAFIGGFPLARQFGLARGFDHYDDHFEAGQSERDASVVTKRAMAFLQRQSNEPLFLWIHYFDPHEPYAAPEPFQSQYPDNPYLAEIAFMDHHLGQVIDAFENQAQDRPLNILLLADHGEGLGEHGERHHGNLLYQSTMRVPMIAVGKGLPAGTIEKPVSICEVYPTMMGWANGNKQSGLFGDTAGVVLGEAMKPYLQYGWQPQVMAVGDGMKMIQSGNDAEIYNPVSDPGETENLSPQMTPPPILKSNIENYPVPVPGAVAEVSQADAERLASLGYASFGSGASLRENAPTARTMTHLFADLDLGSGLFVLKKYNDARLIFERVLAQDPENFMVVVRLAVIHSLLGQEPEAQEYFTRAARIDPNSTDLQHFVAMHYVRFQKWDQAEPLLEKVLERMPNKLPALESLAVIRDRQGRTSDVISLLQQIVNLKKEPTGSLIRLGQLKMQQGESQGAVDAFERAREAQPANFNHHLELGVCYFALRQFAAARDALDQVRTDHPGYPMALFKRAQVSVLLNEPEQDVHIRNAMEGADATTSRLIQNEKLFQSFNP